MDRVESLSSQELIRLAELSNAPGSELEPLHPLIARELGRRGLLRSEPDLIGSLSRWRDAGYPSTVYDAQDGTIGSPEHPEDEQWITRSIN